MAYIKKLKDNELIGGTDNTDMYPVTSTKAVYNPEGVTQEYINNHVDGSKIVDGTITNNKIADSTISMGKLDNDVQTKIQQGTQRAWTPRGAYNENTVYGVNDLVYYTDTNSSYISLQANNQGHNPAWQSATGGWWMKVVDGSYVNLLEEELQQLVDSISEGTQQQVEELNKALEALEAQADQSRQDIQNIVNNLAVVQTTGQSTSDVMSQKAVTDEITIQGTFNLSSATYPSNIISGGGKWASVLGASSILIPVVSGEVIHVVGNGNATGTIYAFLKTNVTTTGTTPSFATGYSGRVVVAGDATFDLTAPADANYLWFMYKNASGSMMPALYSPKNIANIIEETNVYDNTMIDLSLCADSHRNIKGSNQWGVKDDDAYSILLPVSEGEVYEIVAGENICIYSFLTNADLTAKNNSAVSFVTGYKGRIIVSANQRKAITIPTSCKYICFTSHIADINFLPKLYKKSSSNIIDNVGDVNKIKDAVFGKDISLYMSWDRAISGSNKWDVPSAAKYQSKIIPVNEGDFMTLFANSQIAQHYAFLTATDSSAENGSNVSFVAGYETRYEVVGGRADFVIPQGCKFLYILTAEETDIFINNKPLQNLNSANNDESNYNLVYCNDFNDGIDGDFWKAVEWEGQMGSYTSRVLADDNNWYADSGCMVLKLEKRNGIYYGPYISTAKTFAINKGKIEVRVKCNVVNSALGWCFWTFGQNAVWPVPLEIDVFEKITNSDVQSVHYHYKGTDNTNKDVKPTSVTMNEFGTDWHTLGVEWDGFRIKTYYDGVMKSDTTISDSLYPFTYPQQLCFNIKCKDYDAGDAFLFVDYVKVWVDKDESPIIGFEQDDITLSVGGSTYINPTFVPSDCINKAFALTSDNENIVSVEEYEGGHENHFLQRKIVGVAAGVAHLTITAANGSTTKTFTVTVE